jgi:hypothetical protein
MARRPVGVCRALASGAGWCGHEGGCGGERRLEPRNLETPLLQGLVAQLLGEKKAKMEQQEAR